MSNTLRRKMFKLGGSANTHGVGITSGLKMNKGGRVKLANGSPGPRGYQTNTPEGLEILMNLINPDRLSSQGFTINSPLQAFARTDIGKSLLPEGETRVTGKIFNQFLEANPDLAFEYYKGLSEKEPNKRSFGLKSIDPIDVYSDKLSEALDRKNRLFTDEEVLTNPYLRGSGEVSNTTQSMQNLLDKFGKGDPQTTDTEPADTEPADTEPSEIEKEESVNNAIKNIDDDDALDFESPEDQLSFEDQVKRRSELYKNLMETDDKQKVLAQAILAGSTALLEGGGSESYAKAGKAVGDVLSNQADSLRKLRNAATTQAISDVTSTDATIRAAENQARLLNIREDRTDARAEKTLELQRKKQEATDEKTRLTGIIALEESYGDQAPDQYKRMFEGAGDFELMPIETTGDKKGSFDDDVLKAKGEGKTYIYNGDFYVYLNGELQNLGSDLTAAQNILESFKKQLRG